MDIVGRDQHGRYGSVGVSVGSHEPGNQQPLLVRRQRKTHSKASRLQVVFSLAIFRINQTYTVGIQIPDTRMLESSENQGRDSPKSTITDFSSIRVFN